MAPLSLSRTKTRLLVGAALAVFIAPFAVIARSGSTPVAPDSPPIQTVGASVLLRLQREGAPVYDFRRDGQTIPGAVRVNHETDLARATSLALIGDENQLQPLAKRLHQRDHTAQIYIIPTHMVAAYPDFPGVRQIEPRKFVQLKSRAIPVFDFAEAEEFEFARVAGSTRVPWEKFIAGDRSFLTNKNATIALICPVGSRSQLAAQKLQREGVRVLNVRGGMIAWQNAELPVNGGSARRSTPDAN